MSEPIGYTRREIVELMLSNGIHCGVDAFMQLAAQFQQRALVFAVGPQKAREAMQGEQIDQLEVTNAER
jgi:hypothetical protein